MINLKRKVLVGYSVLITIGFAVILLMYISNIPKSGSIEKITSIDVSLNSTREWHQAYLDDTTALKYTHPDGSKETLVGFALDRDDIKRIKQSILILPKQIFIFFGKKEDEDGQQNYVLMFSAVDKYVDDKSALILLPDDSMSTDTHLLYEYCDPCPPKCPSNVDSLKRRR